MNLGEVVKLETIAARCQGVLGVDELDVTSSRKVAKKVVDVNVEKAAGDRELRGLLEPRELRRTLIRKHSGARGARTDDSVGP